MDRFDWLFIGGVALVATGAGMAWLPAGLIVAGAGLIVFGFMGARAVNQAAGARENQ